MRIKPNKTKKKTIAELGDATGNGEFRDSLNSAAL